MTRTISGGGKMPSLSRGRPGFRTMKRIKRVLTARTLMKNDPADGLNQARGRVPFIQLGAKGTRTIGAGNAAVLFTSVKRGPAGNTIRTAHVVAGLSTPFSIVVSGNDVTVNAQTDGAGVSLTTALVAKEAVNAHATASKLVTASLPGTGASVITASALAVLAGGALGSVRSRTEPEFSDSPPSPAIAGHEETLPKKSYPVSRKAGTGMNRSIEKR